MLTVSVRHVAIVTANKYNSFVTDTSRRPAILTPALRGLA